MGHFAFRLPLLDRITRLAFGEGAGSRHFLVNELVQLPTKGKLLSSRHDVSRGQSKAVGL